ncbi:MAG: hypothetical protein FVQ83_11560 [Chloroflexi bacterium]|nr:hypothetical protein [Chloroflexota bacterium]
MYNPRTREKMQPWKIHPVWRGIGCIISILIPIIAFAAADLIIEANIAEIGIPGELRATVETYIFGRIRFFWAKVVFGLVISVGLFAVLTFIYAIIYRMTGQGSRGPMDAPPVRRHIKKRDL